MPAMSTSFDEWLRSLGFKGNPFAEREAERERLLPTYFIAGPHYSDMLGDLRDPRTSILFADRGCGKTAYRLMIAQECRPARPDSPVLAATYTKFSRVLRVASGNPTDVTLEDHLEEVVRSIISSLLEELEARPEPFLMNAPEETKSFVRALVQRYIPKSLYPSGLRKTLQRIAGKEQKVSWDEMWQSNEPRHLSMWLLDTPLAMSRVARFWVRLYETVPGDLPNSHKATLEDLTEALPELDIDGVYLLVDELDENQELLSPKALSSFLEPLMSDWNLMKMPGLGIKFFLPRESMRSLTKRESIRWDRLPVYVLEWDDVLLRQLLQDRLGAFSDGSVRSLDAFSEIPVDKTLIRESWGRPRTLILLGDLLLKHAFKLSRDEPLIPASALDEAIEEFRGRYPILLPHLRLDEQTGEVFIGSQRVPEKITETEFKALTHLYRNAGRLVGRGELVDAAFGTRKTITDQAVDAMMSRLRRKIEPDPSRPMYLITVRGRGYRLEVVRK